MRTRGNGGIEFSILADNCTKYPLLALHCEDVNILFADDERSDIPLIPFSVTFLLV